MFRTNQTSAPIELEILNSKNIQNLEGTHSGRPVFSMGYLVFNG